MKRLEIEIHKSRPNDKRGAYYIYIPPRRTIYFKNKKDAEKAVRKLKKLLFDNVNILSNMSVTIYAMYRGYYNQLPYQTHSYVKTELHAFDEQIDFVFKTYSNGNQSIAFSKIYVLFNCIKDAVSSLHRFTSKSKSYSNLTVQLNCISKEIQLLENNIVDEFFDLDNQDLNYRKHIKIVHLKNVKSI